MPQIPSDFFGDCWHITWRNSTAGGDISWDDIDIGMPRRDYDCILDTIDKEIPKYLSAQTYRNMRSFPYDMIKVRNFNIKGFIPWEVKKIFYKVAILSRKTESEGKARHLKGLVKTMMRFFGGGKKNSLMEMVI